MNGIDKIKQRIAQDLQQQSAAKYSRTPSTTTVSSRS